MVKTFQTFKQPLGKRMCFMLTIHFIYFMEMSFCFEF